MLIANAAIKEPLVEIKEGGMLHILTHAYSGELIARNTLAQGHGGPSPLLTYRNFDVVEGHYTPESETAPYTRRRTSWVRRVQASLHTGEAL